MQLVDALDAAFADAALALRPDPELSVSEWADAHRFLSQTASGEPGPWRTERTPYLKAIMDSLSPASPVERVVFMKGAQIGGTEAGNNWIGYVIQHAPGPMLAVQPTVEMGKRWSKQRIAPLIEGTPALRDRVKEARARDSGNTVQSKEFPGGILVITGANSAVGLRSMPVRYLFLDEVDAYPFDADGEGDPVSLAIQRTVTFANRKIFMVSTPTIQGLSRIELEYEKSDRRRWWVPCPDCGEFQVLAEPQLRWPKGQPERASYHCLHCEAAIPSHCKAGMNARGEWRAEGQGDGRTAGFHLSGLNSPWLAWADIALRKHNARDDAAMKVYVNTIEARSWFQRGEAPDWERLYDRREDYALGSVPQGGLFLTAGADVQKDRIEVSVWAWGRGKESWLVEHRVLIGETHRGEVWAALAAMLQETWPHASGQPMGLRKLGVDSGYATPEVHAWVRTQERTRVHAVDGRHRLDAPFARPLRKDVTVAGRTRPRGLMVIPVGVSFLKEELLGFLDLPRPTEEGGAPYPPGYVHLPKVSADFVKQLTAEHLVTRVVGGRPVREWVLLAGRRNEALDCRNYARAMAALLGLDRFTERQWRELERPLGVVPPLSPPLSPPVSPLASPERHASATPPSATPATRRAAAPDLRPSGWLGRRSGWLPRQG